MLRECGASAAKVIKGDAISKVTQNEEIAIFHYRLGVAVAQWASVELVLRNVAIYTYSAEKHNREALSIGILSLEGFRAKLTVINGIVSRKLAGSGHASEWEKLVERAKRCSTHRNALAHWNMTLYGHRKPGLRVVLSPWTYPKPPKKTKQPVPPARSLATRDIVRYSYMFLALAISIENILSRICKKKESYLKASEEAEDPPPFLTIVDETRSFFRSASSSID